MYPARSFYQAVLKAANAAPASFLDKGSGSGQGVAAPWRRVPDAALHGADMMARPPTLPARMTWHQGDLNADLPIEADRFAMIVAVQVIEHLENLRHMLRDIARLLAPGGVAILPTPNIGSWRSLVTFAARGQRAQFDGTNCPAHITPVSDDYLRSMGAEAGLALQDFCTGSGTTPKLLSRRRQSSPVVGLRLRGKRYSDNYGAVFRMASTR